MTEAKPQATSNEERGRSELNRAFWQTMWSTVALHIVYELSTYVLALFFALKSEELTGLVLAGQWTAFRAGIPWLIVLIGGAITAEPLLRLWRNRVLLRESLAYERLILARYLRQDTERAKELPAANMTDRLQIDLVSYRFSRFTLCANPLTMLLCLVALGLLMQRQVIFASGVLLLMVFSWFRGGRLKSESAQAKARLLELERRKNDRLVDTAEHHDFYYVNQLQGLPRQSLEGTLSDLQDAPCAKDLRTLGHSEEFSENSSLLLYVVAIALGLTLCRLGHMEVSQLVGSLFLLTPLMRLHDLWTEFQEARFTLRECEKRIIAAVTGAPEPMHFDQHEPERWCLSQSAKDRSEDVPPATIKASTIQALRLRQLACAYGDRPIFSDLNLQLERGDLCLLTGPNGSGKTSLLQILVGLQKPAAGSLAWLLPDGTEVQIPVGSPSIQYLPQHPNFFSGAAWQNSWLLAESWAEPEDFAEERTQAQAFLDRFHVAAKINQPIDAQGLPLSGGEQQKLQFSRRLRRPEAQVLILDEPSKFLDQESLPALKDLILQGHEERITVLITHDARLLDLPFSKEVNMEAYRA